MLLGFRARGPEGPKRLPSRVLGALIGVRRCGYVPSAKDASQHPRGPSRARPVSHARFCRPIPLSRAPFCGTGFPRRTGSARGVQTPVQWSCPHCVLLKVNRGPPQALRQGGGLPLVAGEGGGTVHSNPSPTVGWDGGPRPPFVCRSNQGWVGNAAERPTVIRRPARGAPSGGIALRMRGFAGTSAIYNTEFSAAVSAVCICRFVCRVCAELAALSSIADCAECGCAGRIARARARDAPIVVARMAARSTSRPVACWRGHVATAAVGGSPGSLAPLRHALPSARRVCTRR